jgi:hypothetical protein
MASQKSGASLGQSSLDSRTLEKVIDQSTRLHTSSAVALQPAAIAEAAKIDARRRIPSANAVAGTKLERSLLVTQRNA